MSKTTTDDIVNNLILKGLTIEQMKKLPKWLLTNIENNIPELQARLDENERYARANEHHVISQFFSKRDLENLDNVTVAALKRRRDELRK